MNINKATRYLYRCTRDTRDVVTSQQRVSGKSVTSEKGPLVTLVTDDGSHSESFDGRASSTKKNLVGRLAAVENFQDGALGMGYFGEAGPSSPPPPTPPFPHRQQESIHFFS